MDDKRNLKHVALSWKQLQDIDRLGDGLRKELTDQYVVFGCRIAESFLMHDRTRTGVLWFKDSRNHDPGDQPASDYSLVTMRRWPGVILNGRRLMAFIGRGHDCPHPMKGFPRISPTLGAHCEAPPWVSWMHVETDFEPTCRDVVLSAGAGNE